ncbi:MAG: hypothetical protein LUH14_06595 [Clostridiaceae bacterium]|nr:hypothetical protein [Clostridiaceae bacterium]
MNKKRGEFGYLKAKKKKSLLGTFAMALAGFVIFFLGLFLNDMSKQNIFTIIAVLFVLPGAKFLVGYIVVFPYHAVSKERFDRVKEKMPENAQLYTDMVITSAEKVMHLDFAVVGNGQVIALTGPEKQDLAYVRNYLTKGVHNWGTEYKVKILDSEKRFLLEVSAMQVKEADKTEEDRVKSFLISLVV